MTAKFCVDCAHEYQSICYSPKHGRDLVTGRVKIFRCEFNRDEEHRCGRSAEWFEPKINEPEVIPQLNELESISEPEIDKQEELPCNSKKLLNWLKKLLRMGT